MCPLRNVFKPKEGSITSYEDFWNWFKMKQQSFFKAVQQGNNIEQDFFDQLAPKLNELQEGFFYLTGMCDDNTAELIITAEGIVKDFVFVEELIQSAPKIEGWKFTALKPAIDLKDVFIEMGGYKFNDENISFYSNDLDGFPDEIDITVVHDDLTEENRTTISNGTYIYLDHYLGELDFVTTIDNLAISGPNEKKVLVPIRKLKDFLIWRQKEFIEKYEGIWHDTKNDEHTALESVLENGDPAFAVINTDLLQWDSKAAQPWILSVEIKYDGSRNSGLPDTVTSSVLDEIEIDLLKELKDVDGYLNIGQQTAAGIRTIYFACKEFRTPSKVLRRIQRSYTDRMEISYDVYKDKYWRSFDRFRIS